LPGLLYRHGIFPDKSLRFVFNFILFRLGLFTEGGYFVSGLGGYFHSGLGGYFVADSVDILNGIYSGVNRRDVMYQKRA